MSVAAIAVVIALGLPALSLELRSVVDVAHRTQDRARDCRPGLGRAGVSIRTGLAGFQHDADGNVLIALERAEDRAEEAATARSRPGLVGGVPPLGSPGLGGLGLGGLGGMMPPIFPDLVALELDVGVVPSRRGCEIGWTKLYVP